MSLWHFSNLCQDVLAHTHSVGIFELISVKFALSSFPISHKVLCRLSPFFPRLEEFEADNASGNFINIFCTSTNALFVCAKIVRFLLFRKYLIEFHAPKAETTASITLIIVKTTSSIQTQVVILKVLMIISSAVAEPR